ncbi:hypothetical protein BOX15_Mlig020090g2 [Macrostomum lignano]|uniref:C-type lectin domain-containing protein n=1 Tax=Macrostomum lignano TaxID=282301 RepID=A0A267ENS3_9PLAT|nr:hypothetical protein BOX15_Mlig020090g2 [Macrostomum lignano]
MLAQGIVTSAAFCFLLICISAASSALTPNVMDACGDASWNYYPLSGKCYKRISNALAVNQSEAKSVCSAAAARLIQLDSRAESLDFFRYCIKTEATGSSIWTDAVNDGGTWQWQTSGLTVKNSSWDPSGGATQSGSCAFFTVTFSADNAEWSQSTGLRKADCGALLAVFCEKSAATCNPSTSLASQYNSLTMRLANTSYGVEFYPDTANYGQLINVQCRPGFYRASDSLTAKVSYPVTADGLRANQIYCFADGSFASNVIEVCNPIRCNATMLKTDLKIPHVKPYESVLTSNFYNYTDSFTVNCSRGYVSYTNLSSVRSSVACGQNWIDKTMGEWQPPDLNTCTAVKCEPIMNVINPNSISYKAYNREDSREYGEFQLSSFPYYPNQVSIKCKQAGYFFEDRQFDKIIKCDLSNGSLISGQWIGIYGTDLNNLKTINCKPVSCLSDTLMPRSTDASTLIKTKSFKNNVTIEFGNGTRVTVEAAAVNIPDEYPYASVIAFQCTETSDTGVGEPIAYCKSDGTWNITQLPSCIQKTANLDLAGRKHYVPPAKEADSAQSIGAVVIIILVMFSVLVIVLDLSTLSRDINLLKTNLKRLKSLKKLK